MVQQKSPISLERNRMHPTHPKILSKVYYTDVVDLSQASVVLMLLCTFNQISSGPDLNE
jgi:hypothetical protein